ncbi:MAG: 30S ribosomal protein S4 [Candidatus Taylorbacteria bacterium RIFCSPHIGHO2_02_FULL_47_18]|uniref:Small ribosomal subunit protein uS4 n=1 Tax=Candidatus Taylorbacteria bacterium RIFCSPLOWO2_01_FULL_48_100 TaxID=1802322 RepID=A0A1G2NF15_9BACT|nr:MAG: 30S ribosomal protein S4 [Candidatus Taylorbacteria bacterium RIFCSPHIGHO2_01_FULL_48_38]OHA27999.1 MAG: 30S ribosomal protein S4 [Candidatus Taylorbacteria bacterium RIFCSPHIGHO2_02_FULL_47_18]OHA34039.1 MAG: 30S ribosomal protein S4 [Candidatus Taylorbacteria bacterium RIFCSPLOWO2_01_FULL_48_100]OHA40069.1 MAG: 30S ribosomal protein S4 [Candidatus Taylorbacteria bacterium RIFCSPLOWO2_02_FULL_48_16]OHA45164.1 MAG: 30S ribosomal protein S4 [Candidatus Taylorbacteria bacterium RIFCSPLOWO
MLIGSRYKIARRYGPELFEKTNTQKFALREGQRAGKRMRARSDYGVQIAEKQKVRYLYGLGERQIRKYAREALEKKGAAADTLFMFLETRLDNVAYRAGIAPTRRAARQIVSHGHLSVNGRRLTIPSKSVFVGEMITVRARSIQKKLWLEDEKKEQKPIPAWLSYDKTKREIMVSGMPNLQREELPFRIDSVLEFYRR